MWKAMNLWYFWQSDVPNLSDTKFPDTAEGNIAYNDFLASESDPGLFYDNQLLFSEDRFSFYAQDYKELTQSLAGISKSNGLEFGLVRFSGSDDVFGYVQYIIPNSDAATKAIARGDIFTGVDGTTLTVNNYIDLLFGDNDTYTLNMADITNGTITPNADEVILTKQEALAEDPIYIDKIFEINGEKIGYLMYNQFTNEYDEALNDVFGALKTGGVTSLVLDLRYNPGGSVNTARLLSSMIYGANTQDVFLKARYNLKYQTYLEDNNVELRDFFADKTGAGTALNSVDLSKVYILTTNGTASASELVINGLAPYLDVVQIGETTRGKNEFSVTMVDDKGNDYIYNPQRIANINPDNIWAIQPLIGRNENAAGFSDYTAGLVPDIALAEDLENLGILGDQNEPLLARAIQEITGVTGKRDFTVGTPAKPLTSTKMFTPMKDNMFIDKPAGINFK
jgi:C-terminal processing protease CtpA/Prc